MSQTPHKSLHKMCKSPKSASYQTIKHEKIDYESLNTNCTVVGSNNLNLVKKPQIVTNMSPAYSNPSPGYPPSPYSSPASLKSPSPSLKPPTPQPNFPVMQIIPNNLLARSMQNSQPQNIIKLKPHLNILPKPSASPQPSPKPSVSPQIVMPSNAQPTASMVAGGQQLLLNQMPMLSAPGVQFILRPQTAKLQPQMQAAAPQGLILQSGGQQLLQIPRSQPMVRVLTNGVHLAPSSTTYVTQVGNHQQPINATHIAQQQLVNNAQQHHQQQQQLHHQQVVMQQHQQQMKKKPKHKVKKKLDLANIMKLSGIGDEDDIQFESDTSQSESEPTSVPTTPQPQQLVHSHANYVQADAKKNMQNIQISAMSQPTINAATPVVQVLNQNFQSGMISNSSSQAQAQAGIPFGSFIAPNFTINNGGLMLQRTGGFKLTMGDDGRLVLQHDPTLNQDLQSQLILQSLLGGLVLQPSMDQQTVQQTVQTIQQQSVQTIQQQTVQSQTIQTVQQQTVQPQTVQHTIQSLQPQIQQQTVQHQTIQHQTVNAMQQPMQIVQPQPIHSIHSQVQPMHSISQSQVHSLQSQIQGQIQSLLQQQNHAVQTQPQNVQNLQSVQSIQQNVQGIQQNVQGMQQNVQSLQQNVQSVQQNLQSLQKNVQSVQQTVPGLQQAMQSAHHGGQSQNFGTHHSQSQPVLKVQPFQKAQPPVQTVQPIQHHSMNHQHQQQQQQPNESQQQNQNSNSAPPTSYVVNLTPDQLEQLKRNGQLTVNGQTIFMQRPNKDQIDKKMSPKSKPVKRVNKIQSIKSILQDTVTDPVKTSNTAEPMKEPAVGKPLVSALTAPAKPAPPHHHVQPQHKQASVPPSPKPTPKPPKAPEDVDKLLGQIFEETAGAQQQQQQQRITTIQLTPQKQQQLKSVQVQIQALSARLSTGDAEVQGALKGLFAEQQKILASGKLLPPDKVYYHNNQLTIVNPSSLNLSSPPPSASAKIEPPPSPQAASMTGSNNQAVAAKTTASVETQCSNAGQQPAAPRPHLSPRISLSMPSSETTATQTIHHHPQPPHHHHQLHHHHRDAHVAPQSRPPASPRPNAVNHQPKNVVNALPPASPQPSAINHHHPAAGHQVTTHHHGNLHQNHLQVGHPNHVIGQRLTCPPPAAQPNLQQQQQQQEFQQKQQQKQQQQLQQQQQQQLFHSQAKKAHLIETQLNLDQNGAAKPDVHTPFRDKKEACVRLIRYHCYDQPVLSQKDLDKADEIFELTAQHFIDKFDKMEDKYRYLMMKESMRQVPTSELMMLDRKCLADEQQYISSLREDYENELMILAQPPAEPALSGNQPAGGPNQSAGGTGGCVDSVSEDYDEWACIQRELGCLPAQGDSRAAHQQQLLAQNANHAKRSSSGGDSRLETLKRFRVDKHHKKPAEEETEPENNSIDEQVQSAIDSILNLQQNTNGPLDLDGILS